jgi:hypothetical protein
MNFEYVALKDYVKIANKIECCGFQEEFLTKLKELGIVRAGEILACSEKAIQAYEENAKFIAEAKTYLEECYGTLAIWELIESVEDSSIDEDELPSCFDLVDIDEPWDIMNCIVTETIDKLFSDYIDKNGKGIKLSEADLPEDVLDTLGNDELALVTFLSLSKARITELYSDKTLLTDKTISEIRTYLTNLLSLPTGIFEFFDDTDKRWKNRILRNLK